MGRPGWSVIALVLACAAIVAVWWLWPPRPGATGPATGRSPTSADAPAAAPQPAPPSGATAGPRSRRFRADEPHANVPEAGSAPLVTDDLHREFPTSTEAEAFVDERVLAVLAAIEPDLDPTAVAHECSGDGRHCVFEGPWLGEDLTRKWVGAIAEHRTSLDALEGVRFSSLRQEARDGRTVFVIEAHAP